MLLHPKFTSELKSNHGFSRGAIKNESLHKNAVKIASLTQKCNKNRIFDAKNRSEPRRTFPVYIRS